MQLLYTSQVFAIPILALSKISITWLIYRLSPLPAMHAACKTAFCLTAVFMLFSVFAIAFQCPPPRPYIYRADRCFASGSLLYGVGALNILTDLILALSPLYMLTHVRLRQGNRLEIMAAFGSRLLVVGVTIAWLVSLTHFTHSKDTTWTILIPSILNQ